MIGEGIGWAPTIDVQLLSDAVDYYVVGSLTCSVDDVDATNW